MLFNSIAFLFLFLPVTLGLFLVLKRKGHGRAALALVVVASLVFYGWWDPHYLWLLLGSIMINFVIGNALVTRGPSRLLLWLGVGGNLLCLGWFKYAMFIAGNLNAVLPYELTVPDIILPLGISFFTFLQIAYLVDAHQGKAERHSLIEYMAFVTFFPHLIAGPILNHKSIIPQFHALPSRDYDWGRAAMGLSLLAIGLTKKVLFADEFSTFATPVFTAAGQGAAVSMAEAWTGALGYTLQLYFDFSAYSDMAIGIGLMFGIRLPVNFLSPYKATSIIDFWRTWHMTLSNFLRDYLYIPLGGNRLGQSRRYLNLLITMLLGGFWHGAGWTFIIWGALHGLYLVINHLWRQWFVIPGPAFVGRAAGWVLTMLAVVVAWVFFRSENVAGAMLMLQSMAGQGGNIGSLPEGAMMILFGFAFVLLAPNAIQIISHAEGQGARHWYSWALNKRWVALTTVMLVVSIYTILYLSNRISEFIYFQF